MPPSDPSDVADPELARIEELVAAVSRGRASDAEREELAMYAAEHPDLPARIQAGERASALGPPDRPYWLERVERDERVQQHERTRTTRTERGAGLAMVLAGMAIGFVSPTVGVVAIVGGFAVLMVSFVRVRLRTHRDDPYKDVQQ